MTHSERRVVVPKGLALVVGRNAKFRQPTVVSTDLHSVQRHCDRPPQQLAQRLAQALLD